MSILLSFAPISSLAAAQISASQLPQRRAATAAWQRRQIRCGRPASLRNYAAYQADARTLHTSRPAREDRADGTASSVAATDDSAPARQEESPPQAESPTTEETKHAGPSSSTNPFGSSSGSNVYDSLLGSPDAFKSRVSPSRVRRESPIPLYRRQSTRHSTPLDASERRQWNKLLADVGAGFGSEAHAAMRGNGESPLDSYSLNEFTRRNELFDLYERRPGDRKGRYQAGGMHLARLREGIGAELSTAEIDAGVDEAKQSMNLCMNEADLWAWAAREIWGLRDHSHLSLSEAVIKVRRPSANNHETLDEDDYTPPYGVGTAFYAPVLHRLLIHFRDRLKAPMSALCVPKITRSLGPQSLVLGCTPELYAEALRTRWSFMGDLRGCLELLREARETGVLGRMGKGNTDIHGNAIHSRSLLGVVQSIQDDVRRSVIGQRAASSSPRRSRSIVRDLGGVDDEILGLDLGVLDPREQGDSPPGEASDAADALSGYGTQQPPAKTPAPLHLETRQLSLAALESLRIVDDMGSLIGADAADEIEDDAVPRARGQRKSRQGQGSWSGARRARQSHSGGYESQQRGREELWD